MDTHIIAVYCLCDDLLKALHHYEDPQCQMSDAEVMTTAITAVLYYGGNYAQACTFLQEHNYIPHMLSASRFNRRLHRIRDLFLTLFSSLGEYWKELNTESIYSIDSFPIPVCDNIRIPRGRLYTTERDRGYIASKKRYFYGLKLHLLITKDGQPVEVFLTPGSTSDVSTLPHYAFDLPAGATIYADRGYNDYGFEDDLRDTDGIDLQPMRKKNSKRPDPPWARYLQHHYRKMVETAGSVITQRFPKTIHAVTPVGFELKIVLFVLAFSIDCLKVAT
ncbi:MAG TPA: IS982 family transposase [Anaerolineae bacterium]|nr:IS982 family transposase [Anaerolineae bacterium]